MYLTDAERAFSRRALNSPHWKWLQGQRLTHHRGGHGVVTEDSLGACQDWVTWYGHGDTKVLGGIQEGSVAELDILPLFDDDASKGCLLGLVRKAWGSPKVFVTPPGALSGLWTVWRDAHTSPLSGILAEGGTEEVALLEALEDAPENALGYDPKKFVVAPKASTEKSGVITIGPSTARMVMSTKAKVVPYDGGPTVQFELQQKDYVLAVHVDADPLRKLIQDMLAPKPGD